MVTQELVGASGVACRDTVPAQENTDAVAMSPGNHPVEGEAGADELVALYDAIQSRKDQQQYPLVLPVEVASGGLQREFADEQCAFVRGFGIVQFQSFLVGCYETLRRDVPADPGHPKCPNLPQCPYCAEEPEPCVDTYGSNATCIGGSCGRGDAAIGAVEDTIIASH